MISLPALKEKFGALSMPDKRRVGIAVAKGALYGIGLYIGLAMIAYGLELKRFAESTHNVTAAIIYGRPIREFRSFWWFGTDYFFKVGEYEDELLLPGALLGDDAPMDKVLELRGTDRPIQIRATGPYHTLPDGTRRRLILEMSTPDGTYVLRQGNAVKRFREYREGAALRGTVWIVTGALFALLVLSGARLARWLRKRLDARVRRPA